MVDKGLEMIGLQKLEPPPQAHAALQWPRKEHDITLRIHAAQRLNVDTNGRALSLVTRIYKLRSTAQFMQTPYAMFSEPVSGRSAFDADVVSFREIVLTPGQKYEVIEAMPPEATHLAVVALFRTPDIQRWRFVFESAGAAHSGVTVGAHGCALSVSIGAPIDTAPEVVRLAGARCR
jgi:type VI secretion system protein VasD